MYFDRCITPPEFARWLGVNRDKVLGWIHSGKLRAKNIADAVANRPRFIIPPDAVDDFMNADAQTKRPLRKARKGRGNRDIPDVVSGWLTDTATPALSC